MKLKLRNVGLFAGLAMAVMIGSVRLVRELKSAPNYAEIGSYRRVDWWILSARCAQLKRVLLVGCGADDKLYPIEDMSPSDDRGHALILGLLALGESKIPDRIDLVRINLVLNLVAGLMLVILLWGFRLPYAALGAYAACVWLFPVSVRIAGPDAPAAFFAEFALAVMPSLWIACLPDAATVSAREWAIGALSATALVMAVLLRQAIGLIGIFAMIGTLLMSLGIQRNRSRHRLFMHGILLLFAVAATQSTSLLLALRNRVVNLPPARLVAAHGIAHNIFQGLGTEPGNRWGISYWDDLDGYRTVQKLNPDAGFATPGYYVEIRKAYLRILRDDPWAVIALYGRKLWKTLSLPLLVFGVPYGVFLVLAFGVLVKRWMNPGVSSRSLRAATAFSFVFLLFLTQGVFISYEIRFLYPAKYGVLLLWAILSEEWLTPSKFS